MAYYCWVFAFNVRLVPTDIGDKKLPVDTENKPLDADLMQISSNIPPIPEVSAVRPIPRPRPDADLRAQTKDSPPPEPVASVLAVRAKDADIQKLHFINSNAFATAYDANAFVDPDAYPAAEQDGAVGPRLFAAALNAVLYQVP